MSEQMFQIGVKGLIRNEKGLIFMVHIPKWGHNHAHWDLPGGRMDPGEDFLQTLGRELKEEIGVTYTGKPRQLMGMLTNITIPVYDELVPLVFMIYSVKVADPKKIVLAKNIHENKCKWVSPKEAAELMAFKFSSEFCNLVRNL